MIIDRLGTFFSPIEPLQKKIYRPLTNAEKKTVEVLLRLVAESSSLWLFSGPKEIEECKKALSETHPLQFIKSAVENRENRLLLKKIYDRGSYFWGPFVDKIADQAFDQEKEFQNISPNLEDFSAQVGLDPQRVKTFFNEKNFQGLFHHIFEKHHKL